MAAALVGGAFLSAFLQVLFDRLASRQVLDFFRGRKSSQTLLKKLRNAMNCVEAVLDDAEHKQFTKPSVKRWYDALKAAFHEAEDLMDEIEYEALLLKIKPDSPTVSVEEMEAKLEEILETLEDLVEQKDKLGLREGVGENLRSSSQGRIPSTSLLEKPGVFGRDADKEAIMELMLTERNDLDVIPIVGMGGIGKTTLAQFVYNDNRLQGRFHLKVWICISLEFDVFRVTKDILKELGSTNCDTMTANQLHHELKEKVKDKIFLLVLDDVWNPKHEDWDSLLKPLKYGANGSKIILTTRNESVASYVRTTPSHRLKELKVEECWSLFVKRAFGDENSSVPPELDVIGREIVKRCKGLPLAIKLLGGLLQFKSDVNEWRKILESDMWNLVNDEILPALMLSYFYLPSHLKRCFASCALFPHDYKFKMETIVLLWMAEGLIAQPSGSKQMKEVGEEFFHDLVSMSFFQQSRYGDFVMHDLLNDLAKRVSGEFCSALDAITEVNNGKRIRHLYCSKMDDVPDNFVSICEMKSLRTLWKNEFSGRLFAVDTAMVNDLLQRLRCLRVLSLFQAPTSIVYPKHLRYLDFTRTQIKELPESITSLYHLQTLILFECKELVKLPADMASLINLCHLDIGGTKLQEMPPRMGELKRLECLTDFFVGKNSGSSIKELGKLKHLRGTLRVWNLGNAEDARDALEADLKGKKHLKQLELGWDRECGNSQHDRDVLEKLQPHTNLERLCIINYGGTRFPNWIGDSSFTNMISLKLLECKYCFSLPPLGQLTSLKDLEIRGCEGVEVIGLEFYGSGTSTMKPFPSLESLWFENMSEWREWISYGDEEGGGAFPLLRNISIKDCPNLMRTPIFGRMTFSGSDGFLCLDLDILEISRCDFDDSLFERMELMGYSSFIQTIRIKVCDSLKCFPMEMFPNLSSLHLESCTQLNSICVPDSPHGDLTSLTHLEIQNCPNFISLPEGGLTSLTHLKIHKCRNFIPLLEEGLTSLTYLEIQNCPNFISLPEGGLTSLTHLIIHNCPDFISLPEKGVTSLTHLKISCCRNFIFFPERRLSTVKGIAITSCNSLECFPLQLFPDLRLLSLESCAQLTSLFSLELNANFMCFSEGEGRLSAPKLKILRLLDCPKLKSLPDCMQSLLPSLVILSIEECPEVESFPDGGLPSKLESLFIGRCDKLIAGRGDWNLQMLSCLSRFEIVGNNDDVESFPVESLLPSSSLTSMILRVLVNLKSLDCKVLRQFTCLEDLRIFDCNVLEIQSTVEEGLHHLTSLQVLVIGGCHKICSMPKEGLPSSLTYLTLQDLPNLESLDCKGLQQLTSLRELTISYCPKLKCIPHEGLPSSLSSLWIYGCPMLEQRCKREKGEDWPKISHIPHIDFEPEENLFDD